MRKSLRNFGLLALSFRLEKTKKTAEVEVTSFPTPTVEESGVTWWLVLGNQAGAMAGAIPLFLA